MNQALYIICWY